MLRAIQSYAQCRDFVSGFRGDPVFSSPMLCNEEQLRCNLLRPIEAPDRHCVLGVWREGRMTGLFAFLVLREERYLEMLVGLSREGEAYREVLGYLEEHYPGYSADFVFGPGNYLMKEALDLRGAACEPEQNKLRLKGPVPAVDTGGVELLTPAYAEQYCRLHHRDVYWTGERLLQAQDRFHSFLAIRDGQVVGYMDVSCTLRENEPYDLLVAEEYRRMGYGRRLLATALKWNRPNGMMVLLDADNRAAIRLYESMGFATVPGENSITAHWTLPQPSGN